MPVAHKVANQTSVVRYAAGSTTIGHPCSLYDRTVISHVIHNTYKAMIKCGDRRIEFPLEGWYRHTRRFVTLITQCINLIMLLLS